MTTESQQSIHGSCLCGQVEFTLLPPFKLFQYCHCSRCRKVTGSAFAANIYTHIDQISWTKGTQHITRFEHPTARYFAHCFCDTCGSSLPWQIQGGETLIVPAGCIDTDLSLKPKQSINWQSKATWYCSTDTLPKFDTLPPKNSK